MCDTWEIPGSQVLLHRTLYERIRQPTLELDIPHRGQAPRALWLLRDGPQAPSSLTQAMLAAALLAPFDRLDLRADTAAAFPALLNAYGEPWCRMVLAGWDADPASYADVHNALPPLCEAPARLPGGAGRGLVRHFLHDTWAGC